MVVSEGVRWSAGCSATGRKYWEEGGVLALVATLYKTI